MIASRSNLERYGYGNYEIETWQPLGFSTDRIRTTKVHIQDQVFAVHVADITTHTNIEKQAEIESEEFLTPSDDEIHHDLVLEADVKAFTVDNCSNGELSRAADLGLAQLHDMRTNAEMIANLAPIGAPVIADMDTGYGGPLMVAKSLQQYHLAGVAGFHIEDQVAQKRCGHLAGKEVVNIEEYASRIKACVYKRKQLRSDIVIIARTDVLQSRGYVAAMERVHRARDLGADMGILEGVQSKEQAAQAVRELAPWLMCYNSVENGVSPLISAAEAEQMGYRIIIFSFACLAPAYEAIKSTLERLKGIGLTGSSVSPMTIFEVCGL
ncbi:hypothetical protein VC83_01961 [Pseudogymnoascus destructans]|uniref:Uncharacterized protein n=1 Tax=Pseudogymnoascus destructans TaxID=655981 RepID=A0A177AJB2_9PEZI|nr:uncharacterized protein VC83_01961 [Pseudogymnoascus destructans]OAF61264.1 hypothetical protein VC83_01961 [Pseudogymnoascus destructans]